VLFSEAIAALLNMEFYGAWRVLSTLSEGNFGCVHKAVRAEDKTPGALKTIPIDEARAKYGKMNSTITLWNELAIHSECEHPHIVTCLQTFTVGNDACLVLELMTSDVLTEVLEHGAMTEAVAFTFTSQIISAVAYVHSQGIAHRDVKLENVMRAPVIKKSEDVFKLSDFGLARKAELYAGCRTLCGTFEHVAPEILNVQSTSGSYGQQVDMWAFGISLFKVLTNDLPYEGRTQDFNPQIRKGQVCFPKNLSGSVNYCIQNMLLFQPHERVRANAFDFALIKDFASLSECIFAIRTHTKTFQSAP